MTKYIVYLTTTSSTSVEVEADSREEAEQSAYVADMPTICAQCSGMRRSEGQPALELDDDWEVSSVCDEDGNEIPAEGDED